MRLGYNNGLPRIGAPARNRDHPVAPSGYEPSKLLDQEIDLAKESTEAILAKRYLPHVIAHVIQKRMQPLDIF